jgi:nitroreductase
MEAIQMRRSVRAYDRRPIPADVLERMRTALWAAPSACNNQPWHFILVTDADLRRQVAELANDQMWLADAPVIVAACGLTEHAARQMAGHRNSVEVDVAIALDHLTLAAVAEGLGTCWIGAFQEKLVKKLLGIPENLALIALMPLGYPATDDLLFPLHPRRRKPHAQVFSTDHYAL